MNIYNSGGRRGRFSVKASSSCMTGSGYTLSGVPGRFLLPENPVSSSSDVAGALDALPAGHEFSVPDVLFAKITDEQREDWQTRFAGTRE